MAVRTSNEAYYRHVSAEEPLDNAVAHTSAEHPHLPECNFVSDVLIEELQAEPEAVFDAVQAYFAQRGVACHRWIPALQQPVETLESLLGPRGYVREETITLLRPPAPTAEADPRVTMLPARAMRRACRAVLESRFAEFPSSGAHELGQPRPGLVSGAEGPHGGPAAGGSASGGPASDRSSDSGAGGKADSQNPDERRVSLHLQRLNDPQYDALVAMVDEQPAGFVAVHQVGEIGRIRDLYVLPQRRRQGIATAMLHYAVATAQRWLLRPICAQAPAADPAGRALFEKLDFEEAGTLVRFRLADTPAERVL